MSESTRPLRIVHVLGSFEVGGAEQVVLNLADHQVRDGHQVFAISLARGRVEPNEQKLKDSGVVTLHVTKPDQGIDPTLPVKLALAFKRLGADVVHTHNPLPGIYGPPAARLVGIPCVHTKHGANEASRRAAWLRRTTHRMASALVAVSQETARQSTSQGEVASTIHVIENGIPLSAFAPNPEVRAEVRRELHIPDSAVIVGTVARLAEVKNQPLLVRAVAPLLNEGVRLVLVGDGPNRPSVEAAVADCGVGGYVHFVGQRLDVPRFLCAFDVFALSSDSEGLPMVLPEAMTCTLPVVSTAVGGIPDVIREGTTGFLVPKGDELALREKLGKLISNQELRERMGVAAREDALTRYSSQVMHERYLALYRQLCH